VGETASGRFHAAGKRFFSDTVIVERLDKPTPTPGPTFLSLFFFFFLRFLRSSSSPPLADEASSNVLLASLELPVPPLPPRLRPRRRDRDRDRARCLCSLPARSAASRRRLRMQHAQQTSSNKATTAITATPALLDMKRAAADRTLPPLLPPLPLPPEVPPELPFTAAAFEVETILCCERPHSCR
jgi:hypothetical protein